VVTVQLTRVCPILNRYQTRHFWSLYQMIFVQWLVA